MKNTFKLLFALLIVFSSCKSKKNVVSETSSNSQTKPTTEEKNTISQYQLSSGLAKTEVFFSMERTACYGKCPTYKVEIMRSGEARYTGKRNVENIGEFITEINDEIIVFILNEAKKARYFDLQDRYDGLITDLPACITLLNTGSNSKQIYDRYQAPEELKQFQKAIEDRLSSVRWTANGGLR